MALEGSDGEIDAAFDRQHLASLRAWVADFAGSRGADSGQIEHLVLVASELASNAILYGGGSGRIRIWSTGPMVYLSVSDRGPGLANPETVGLLRPPPLARGGRGLWVTRLLADDLSIATSAEGTTIVVGFRLQSPADGLGRQQHVIDHVDGSI